jgi:hypothetical protein
MLTIAGGIVLAAIFLADPAFWIMAAFFLGGALLLLALLFG